MPWRSSPPSATCWKCLESKTGFEVTGQWAVHCYTVHTNLKDKNGWGVGSPGFSAENRMLIWGSEQKAPFRAQEVLKNSTEDWKLSGKNVHIRMFWFSDACQSLCVCSCADLLMPGCLFALSISSEWLKECAAWWLFQITAVMMMHREVC